MFSSTSNPERFAQNVGDVMTSIGATEIGLFVETAGKTGQLGSVDEILEISNQVPGVFPCVDFGHIHALTGGSLGSEQAILDLLESSTIMAASRRGGGGVDGFAPSFFTNGFVSCAAAVSSESPRRNMAGR